VEQCVCQSKRERVTFQSGVCSRRHCHGVYHKLVGVHDKVDMLPTLGPEGHLSRGVVLTDLTQEGHLVTTRSHINVPNRLYISGNLSW
jgi:hypothetical protein